MSGQSLAPCRQEFTTWAAAHRLSACSHNQIIWSVVTPDGVVLSRPTVWIDGHARRWLVYVTPIDAGCTAWRRVSVGLAVYRYIRHRYYQFDFFLTQCSKGSGPEETLSCSDQRVNGSYNSTYLEPLSNKMHACG